jgi:probable HAF family extracellular repeat protein
MNSRKLTQILTASVLLFLRGDLLIAQESPLVKRPRQPRYRLVDLGTLGGPISYGSANGDGGRLLNDAGVVSSYADTTLPDPNAPDFCFDADCLVAHAYRWRNGVMSDLGALADTHSSLATSINDRGWSLGASQTGLPNPAGFPQNRAVLWTRRRMINLGTLPGGSDSIGISVNNAGQAVGISDNGVPDPFSLFGIGVQVRTFLWQKGKLHDIGSLGGPDTLPGPGCDNQRPGVIVGVSYTSFIPNASTGIPTQDPFLWDHGRMTDLGNLGGTFNFGQCTNSRGDVIGQSTLPGDQVTHAFVWHRGRMKDLGTLGGDNSEAIWINGAGDIVGSADLPAPDIHDAVRWRHGHILDLGTVGDDACSRGRAINSKGQIVGGSSDCRNFLHAFVWEEGGPMLDLNTLIPPGSGLQLTNAFNINDRGEILAKSVPLGVPPIDDEDLGHVVLLIPCEADDEHCENDIQSSEAQPMLPGPDTQAAAKATSRPPGAAKTMNGSAAAWRARLARQFQIPVVGPEH